MTGNRFTLHGKRQWLRLDPGAVALRAVAPVPRGGPHERAVARTRPPAGRRTALVQGRDHLPAAREVVLRCQQRRHRRLPRPDLQARLHRRPRRQRDLAAAVLSLAAARRRLRHRRLHHGPSRVRQAGRRQEASSPPPTSAACASSPSWSSTTPPTSIRGSSAPARPSPARPRATSTSGPTPTRSTRARASSSSTPSAPTGPGIPVASAYYWHRFYAHQPDLNFDNPKVLEAVLERDALLARPRGRRAAARRRALPGRARGHQQREPARDARGPEADPRRDGRALSRPHAAGRGQPVAGGHQGLFRRRRRMPHGVPLPADAAHVHGAGARGPLPDHRHHAPDAADSRQLPVGDLPAQSRRADARDGDRFGARLSLADLRHRPPRPHQSRHPPPARAAARARPPPHRADELPAALDARHAGDLLRRRDRHGRQHPARRPRRRAHADAMVARPQRRLLARRLERAGAAHHPGPALRLRDGERRGAVARSLFAAALDAPHADGAAQPRRLRPRRLALPLSEEPQGAGLSARVPGRDDPVRRQRLAHAAGGRARSLRVRGPRADRAERRLVLPADRPAHLPADPAALRLLLVRAGQGERGAVLAHARAGADARLRHSGAARRTRPPA